jgi:hypothetical protein
LPIKPTPSAIFGGLSLISDRSRARNGIVGRNDG